MFCFYEEEPQFAMEHYLPFQRQHQRRRPCHRRNNPYQRQMDSRRYFNPIDIFEQFFEEAEDKVCSEERQFESMRDYFEAIETVAKALKDGSENENSEKAIEEKKSDVSDNEDEIRDNLLDEMDVQVQPEQSKEVMVEKVVTKFGSKVSVNETLEKVEIKVDLFGHKFNAEHLDVQVVDGNLLIVKAEDGDKKFERKFKLPQNANIDKIQPKFSKQEEEDKQTMTINIPKEVKIVQLPIAMDE